MTAGRSDRFIKSYVCELDDPIFTSMSPVTLKVYEICRRLANYKDELWWDGKQYITIPRGSLVTSVLSLSRRFRLSRQQIRSALRTLFAHRLLTNDSTNRSTNTYTILSVTNYGAYSGTVIDGQPTDQPTDQPKKKPTTNQRLTTLIESVEVVEEACIEDAVASSHPAAAGKRAATRADLTPEQEPWFAAWYSVYPKKVAKPAARKAFGKRITSQELCDAAIDATKAGKGGADNSDPKYIPHPASWLNQTPWEDPDPPAQSTALTVASKNGSGHNATFAEQNERIRKEKFIARILKEQSRGTHQPK